MVRVHQLLIQTLLTAEGRVDVRTLFPVQYRSVAYVQMPPFRHVLSLCERIISKIPTATCGKVRSPLFEPKMLSACAVRGALLSRLALGPPLM